MTNLGAVKLLEMLAHNSSITRSCVCSVCCPKCAEGAFVVGGGGKKPYHHHCHHHRHHHRRRRHHPHTYLINLLLLRFPCI